MGVQVIGEKALGLTSRSLKRYTQTNLVDWKLAYDLSYVMYDEKTLHKQSLSNDDQDKSLLYKKADCHTNDCLQIHWSLAALQSLQNETNRWLDADQRQQLQRHLGNGPSVHWAVGGGLDSNCCETRNWFPHVEWAPCAGCVYSASTWFSAFNMFPGTFDDLSLPMLHDTAP